MEDLGLIHQLIIPLFGYNITLNVEVIVMTWIVIIVLLCFGFFATKSKDRLPGPLQVIGELFVKHLYELTEDALGKELSKKYAPMICA